MARTTWIWLVLLALPACRAMGPKAMRETYPDYNRAVRDVVSEELLLNIVRMRYLDPIQFMSVGTVSAQFSLDVRTGLQAGIDQEETTALGSGGVNYRNAPTLTFTPRHDTRFTKLLTTPIDINTFAGMTAGQDGWAWALALAATTINGAQGDLFGGRQERFDRRVEILANLQRGGHLSLGTHIYSRAISESVPEDSLTPAHLILAAQNGYRFKSVGDGRVQLTERKRMPALRVREGSLETVASELEELGLDSKERVYTMRTPPELGKLVEESDVLYIGTRPFLGVMRILSGGVQPPEAHQRAGLLSNEVLAGVPRRISEVFRVHSSCARPRAKLAVRHRDYWFYIEDSDTDSRTAFGLLALLYDLELGVAGESKSGPVLTLPLG